MAGNEIRSRSEVNDGEDGAARRKQLLLCERVAAFYDTRWMLSRSYRNATERKEERMKAYKKKQTDSSSSEEEEEEEER